MTTPTPKLSRRLRWLPKLGVWGTALMIAAIISHFGKLNFWLRLGITVAGATHCLIEARS